ncbi:BREX-2 system phosphatase PglZ [Frankia sp. AgKG'84/4]|uniref:BREX-2 system phosphatase PglZ n=1 Tax=Frankia sp. AgKG'84/4 TaxID=573490 RepID=UPI00200D6288|nr:BREX-2 system phosphatase PglZ [Frankia sp. AgKG'84/4]MCL9794158.1 BREX-2 system phosphatase PglZ [Frankia sp. AgKG'84/4]
MTDPETTAGGTGTGVPRVTPAVVLGRVGRLHRATHTNPGGQPRVLLVRAQPDWPAPTELAVGGRPVRVVACVSPLAVLEELTRWTRQPVEDGWLVLLTDADEERLGDTVLAQVHQQRVDVIEPWAAVLEDFGATRTDPRLRAPEDRWVVQALLEARPPAGWPRRPGGLLSREDALAELAAVRLGLPEYGLGAADLDIATMLRWTTVPAATEAFRRLGDHERAGLTAYLGERTGRAGRTLLALVTAGNGDRALALGLVCDCLWPGPDPNTSARPAGVDAAAVERAKVRVERYFGDARLDETAMRAFADASREVVATALAPTRPGTSRLGLTPGATSLTLHPDDEIPALLDTAERLLDELDGQAAGAASDLLRTGFHHRLLFVATTIRDFLVSAESGVDRALLATAAHDVVTAVGSLRAHLLASIDRAEVERAAMAARVVGWLATQPTGSLRADPPAPPGAARASRNRSGGPMTLPAALDAHLDDSAWADVALSHLASGELAPAVGTVYGDLFRVAARRRRALDAGFARLLADWTVGVPGPGAPLLVEEILDRVVAPVVTARGGRRALLVVLDGLSAAVATQLAAELRRDRWQEYDPLGAARADQAAGEPTGSDRRRAAVAALPTITATSRTSLLAGRLTSGDKATEKAAFEQHPRWGRHRARLFHDAELAGVPGAPLDQDLTQALASETPLVAVVINTVDDTLHKGRPRDDGWSLADFGRLRAVLAYARNADRIVIVTSDHGHVIDHGATELAATDAVSARHRVPAASDATAGDGEVELVGPRVLAPGGRIVALWDPTLHYLGRKGGYHGGASPAEVTVPVLAFLPFRLSATSASRDLPPGWRALPDQRPRWWSLQGPDVMSRLGGDTVRVGARAAGSGVAAAVAETAHLPRRRRRPTEEQSGPALFDLPQQTASAAEAGAGPAAPVDSSGPLASSAAAGRDDAVDLLVAGLMASELLRSQLKGLARPLSVDKVEAAVRALLAANGTLATLVVAERAGEIPRRASGFAVNLRRLFNIDNYAVLDELDDGHTLRLNVDLLRQQFGLPR